MRARGVVGVVAAALCLVTLAGLLFGFLSPEAKAGVQAPTGQITLVGTGPVYGWNYGGGTSTGDTITIESWGYFGRWDPADGSNVGPPRLYLNPDGTYNVVDQTGTNVGTGTWTSP
jgi:hypothetical protein